MSQDTLIHRAVTPLVRPLIGTAIRPNHLTAMRLATGLGAAIAFARHETLLATVLFFVAGGLDRADGVLARLSGHTTRYGHNLDLAADCTATIAVFVGLAWSLCGSAFQGWAPALAAGAGCGVVALFWQLNRPRLSQPARPGRRVNFDPDDALLLLPICVWTFGAAPPLIAATIMTPLAALWVALSYTGKAQAARAPQSGS
jgi:archaetidylinositol phosphate synthase